MNKELTNLNDYTLINKSAMKTEIYFYPAHSITKVKVLKPEKEVCVKFDIEVREDGLSAMHCSLLTDLTNEIYNSYSILCKEMEPNKYAIVFDADSSQDAEILPKGVIDFNILDYDYFISVLKSNDDLQKIVPYLADILRENINSLERVQESIEHLEIMGPSSFFQNTIAYFVDRIEELMTKEDEEESRTQILANISKNFDSVFVKDKLQIGLTYLNLIAIIIKNIKSEFIKPISYLNVKELKTDTNKSKILVHELNDILDSMQEDYTREDKKDISVVNERVKFFLKTKPYIKEFKNYIKIIFADDKYLLSDAKVRTVDEEQLKELVIDCLSSFNYRSLERNQVFLFHRVEEGCDFMCIASIDFIFSLLQTYRLNSQVENQVYLKDYRTLINLYRNSDSNNKEELIRIYILLILMINIYYYKNFGSLALFNKGNFILKLEFPGGKYDIQAIDRYSDESIGRLLKISEETSETIKKSLNKSEKEFNDLINGILLDNIEENICLGTVMTDIHSISHKDIVIYLTKNRKKDIFDLTLTLDELLLLLTEFKPTTDIKKEKKEKIKKDPNDISMIKNDKEKDKAFVLRKADTIYNIMEINEIDSDDYRRIAKLYKEYMASQSKAIKDSIIKELKKLILK